MITLFLIAWPLITGGILFLSGTESAKKLALVLAGELEGSSQKGYLYSSKYYDEAGEPA